MTRRSRRELEAALDALGGDGDRPPDVSVDVRERVTAPFVTYEPDTQPGDRLPADLRVAEVVGDGDGPGATFAVVEAAEDGGDP